MRLVNNDLPISPDATAPIAWARNQSKTESPAADPTEPLCNHRGGSDRHRAADLRCYVYAPSRRATESEESWRHCY